MADLPEDDDEIMNDDGIIVILDADGMQMLVEAITHATITAYAEGCEEGEANGYSEGYSDGFDNGMMAVSDPEPDEEG